MLGLYIKSSTSFYVWYRYNIYKTSLEDPFKPFTELPSTNEIMEISSTQATNINLVVCTNLTNFYNMDDKKYVRVIFQLEPDRHEFIKQEAENVVYLLVSIYEIL
ncbi:MAG: hypothetical protein CM15mV93_180 [Caudoviricetes sp.]|nr:MAG: hypothetical protein CM15mV93_180 [Caudoviricetes sp.]